MTFTVFVGSRECRHWPSETNRSNWKRISSFNRYEINLISHYLCRLLETETLRVFPNTGGPSQPWLSFSRKLKPIFFFGKQSSRAASSGAQNDFSPLMASFSTTKTTRHTHRISGSVEERRPSMAAGGRGACCSSKPSALQHPVVPFRAGTSRSSPGGVTTLLCFAGAERRTHLLHCPACLCVRTCENKYEDDTGDWGEERHAHTFTERARERENKNEKGEWSGS